MGFTQEELAKFRGTTVPDLVGSHPPKLVIVGINPGLWTAATQTHFSHPSNRFYPALYRAGITARSLDRVNGLTDDDRRELVDQGLAITNVVARATARASELTAEELRAGAAALTDRIAAWRPKVVAILGITTYRTAFRRPRATLGEQDAGLGGAALWVLPNPSGLNAHETIDSLAGWFRQVAHAAGLVLHTAPGE